MDPFRQENEELRREVAHLRQVDAERQATVAGLLEKLEIFQEQIALLKKALFAPRRERFIPSADQKLLFEGQTWDTAEESSEIASATELAIAEDEKASEEPHSDPAPKKRRARRKRFEFPQCLPVKRIEHPLPDEARMCPCG